MTANRIKFIRDSLRIDYQSASYIYWEEYRYWNGDWGKILSTLELTFDIWDAWLKKYGIEHLDDLVPSKNDLVPSKNYGQIIFFILWVMGLVICYLLGRYQ